MLAKADDRDDINNFTSATALNVTNWFTNIQPTIYVNVREQIHSQNCTTVYE